MVALQKQCSFRSGRQGSSAAPQLNLHFQESYMRKTCANTNIRLYVFFNLESKQPVNDMEKDSKL
jgi:hypothetical protein